MNKNMIINGIDNESITMYKELTEYGFEDIVFIDSDINKVRNLNDKFANTIAFYGNSGSAEFLEFVGIKNKKVIVNARKNKREEATIFKKEK